MSLFGFTEINDNEALIFYKNNINGYKVEVDNKIEIVEPKEPIAALEEIELIDRLLIIQKNKNLLNKKRNLKRDIDRLLSDSVGYDYKLGYHHKL